MNDSLIVYIKKNIFDEIDNKIIIKRFLNMKLEKNKCKFFHFKSILKLILFDMS
jgi:hypothetical protein